MATSSVKVQIFVTNHSDDVMEYKTVMTEAMKPGATTVSNLGPGRDFFLTYMVLGKFISYFKNLLKCTVLASFRNIKLILTHFPKPCMKQKIAARPKGSGLAISKPNTNLLTPTTRLALADDWFKM